MTEIRAKRIALSAVLSLLAGLVSVVVASASAPAVAAAPAADPGTYQALTPARILDTGNGTGAPTAPVDPAATLNVTVLGEGDIPSSGVSAVVFNLTDAGPTTYGYITAYPAGQSLPLASSINFSAGETRAHLVVVAPGSNGQVALYNGSPGPVDLVADVAGYYTAGTPTAGGEFAPLTPARILDTRTGNGAPEEPLTPPNPVVVQVLGRGGVPTTGVSSVVMNLTATRSTAFGYITAGPTTYPAGSSVNFYGGRSVSNLVVVPVNAEGVIGVRARLSGQVDVVADVVGYFVGGPPAAAGRFGGVTPARLLDTRRTHTPVPAQGSIDVTVAGLAHVPAKNVSAAVLNVTVATAPTSGFLAAYPTGISRPDTSTVNFDHNTVANSGIVPLGPDGKVRVYNSSSAPVDVVIDVSGYVGPVPGPLTWSARAPIPGATTVQRLSCGSPTFCMAFDYTLTDKSFRYDGHTWSSVSFPGLSARTLSCAGSGFCTNGPYTFDGTQWAASPFPAWGQTDLFSISCVSATFCVAAGRNGSVVGAAVYNGSRWTEDDPGMPSGGTGPRVSCVSKTFCLLVNAGGQTARFDGASWTALSRWIGDPVSAVSCLTETFCLAAFGGVAAVNAAGRWGPSTILDVQTDRTDDVETVACTSTTSCIAATYFGYQLFYDGTSWTKALELDPAAIDLANVACVGRSFCMLVDSTGYLTAS